MLAMTEQPIIEASGDAAECRLALAAYATSANLLRTHARLHEIADSLEYDTSLLEVTKSADDGADDIQTISKDLAWAELVAAHALLLPQFESEGMFHRSINLLDEAAAHLRVHRSRVNSWVSQAVVEAVHTGDTPMSPEELAIETYTDSVIESQVSSGSILVKSSSPALRDQIELGWVVDQLNHPYLSKQLLNGELEDGMQSAIDEKFSKELIRYAIAKAAESGRDVKLDVDTTTGKPTLWVRIVKEVEEVSGWLDETVVEPKEDPNEEASDLAAYGDGIVLPDLLDGTVAVQEEVYVDAGSGDARVVDDEEGTSDLTSDTQKSEGNEDVVAFIGIPEITQQYVSKEGKLVLLMKYNKCHGAGGQFSSCGADGTGKLQGADEILAEQAEVNRKAKQARDRAALYPDKAAEYTTEATKLDALSAELGAKAEEAKGLEAKEVDKLISVSSLKGGTKDLDGGSIEDWKAQDPAIRRKALDDGYLPKGFEATDRPVHLSSDLQGAFKGEEIHAYYMTSGPHERKYIAGNGKFEQNYQHAGLTHNQVARTLGYKNDEYMMAKTGAVKVAIYPTGGGGKVVSLWSNKSISPILQDRIVGHLYNDPKFNVKIDTRLDISVLTGGGAHGGKVADVLKSEDPPTIESEYVDKDGEYVLIVKYNRCHAGNSGKFTSCSTAGAPVVEVDSGGKGKWRGSESIEEERSVAAKTATDLRGKADAESDPTRKAKLEARADKWEKHSEALAEKRDRAAAREGKAPKQDDAADKKPVSKPAEKPHDVAKPIDEPDDYPSNDPAHDTPKMAQLRARNDALEQASLDLDEDIERKYAEPSSYNKKYQVNGQSYSEPSDAQRDIVSGKKKPGSDWEMKDAHQTVAKWDDYTKNTPQGQALVKDRKEYAIKRKELNEQRLGIDKEMARNDFDFLNEKYGPMIDSGKVKVHSVDDVMGHTGVPGHRKQEYLDRKKDWDDKTKVWADELGIPHERLQLVLQAKMNDEMNSSTFDVRVNQSNLGGVLGSGRVKTQFETNKSNGYFEKGADGSHKLRSEIEHQQFGTSSSALASERPVYGYMGNRKFGEPYGQDHVLDYYGDVVIHGNSAGKGNQTFTYSDSLDSRASGLAWPMTGTPAYAYGIGAPRTKPYVPYDGAKIKNEYKYGSPFGRGKSNEDVVSGGKLVGSIHIDGFVPRKDWEPYTLQMEQVQKMTARSPIRHNTLTSHGVSYTEVQHHGGHSLTQHSKGISIIGPFEPNAGHVSRIGKLGLTFKRDSNYYIDSRSDKGATWFSRALKRAKAKKETIVMPEWATVGLGSTYLKDWQLKDARVGYGW